MRATDFISYSLLMLSAAVAVELQVLRGELNIAHLAPEFHWGRGFGCGASRGHSDSVPAHSPLDLGALADTVEPAILTLGEIINFHLRDNHMSKIDSGFPVAHWDGAHIGIVPSVKATGILGTIFILALSSGLVRQTAVEFHVRYLKFSFK